MLTSSPGSPSDSKPANQVRVASRDYADFDELSESFVDFECEYMQVGTGPVRARLSRVDLGDVVLLRGSEEAPQYVINSTNGENATLLLLGASSRSTYWLGRRADERTLLSYAPGAEHAGHSRGPMNWFTVHVPPAVFERQQAALGLEPTPIVTGPVSAHADDVDLLRRTAAHAFDVAADPDALAAPELSHALEQSVLTAAVQAASCPPQRAGAAMSRERAVRRALDVLASRSREPLYLADLCEAASVSERTLRNAFRDFYGLSPIRFLQVRRMGMVRRALLEADPERDRVSPIAARFGFTNLGRFAVEFRRLFGVSPSQLLRASGGRRPGLIRA